MCYQKIDLCLNFTVFLRWWHSYRGRLKRILFWFDTIPGIAISLYGRIALSIIPKRYLRRCWGDRMWKCLVSRVQNSNDSCTTYSKWKTLLTYDFIDNAILICTCKTLWRGILKKTACNVIWVDCHYSASSLDFRFFYACAICTQNFSINCFACLQYRKMNRLQRIENRQHTSKRLLLYPSKSVPFILILSSKRWCKFCLRYSAT